MSDPPRYGFSAPLLNAIPHDGTYRLGVLAALVAGGIVALTLASKVQIAFVPVPMTLQTLAVMALAFAYGPWLGAVTFVGFLGAAALGLPLLAGMPERGIGLAYLMGPTGGYLAGFLLAIILVGHFAQTERGGRPLIKRFVVLLAGLALVYLLGALWLMQFVGSLRVAVMLGVEPFVLGDLLKVAVVAVAAPLVANGVTRSKP